jgi:hypothetical protein
VTIYRSILALLASLSADPAEIDREPPRAAAAVAAAYASLAPDAAPTPPPAPAPAKCACGGKCAAGVYKPDGTIVMKCEPNCPCGCRKIPSPGR